MSSFPLTGPLRPRFILSTLLLSAPCAVHADEAALPVVTISASKQEQLLAQTPASVSVFDDDRLQAAGARGLGTWPP